MRRARGAGAAAGRATLAVVLLAAASVRTAAQEPAHGHAPQHEHAAAAADAFATRDASGTAWLPDRTPMIGWHLPAGPWQVMLHGHAFVQYLHESGEDHRRGQQAGSINWLMAMARREAAGGRIGLRAMASLEPWTIAGCGYPNLLATGEVCDGDTIHDRQHPHDLFMELAVEYDRPLTSGVRWHVYGGPAGEPALGPAGFPHRPSAFPNPVAPIAHHWLDSTHITFGVVTAGLSGARWRGEVSAFNGREPDASRTGLDVGPLDSIAARVAVLPTPRVSMQASLGRLREAEAAAVAPPRTDVTRATASVTYHREAGERTLWATTVAYGVNAERSIVPEAVLDERTHALLVESALLAGDRHAVFGRFEVAGKSAHDLHAHEFITSVFTVAKLQGGYTRYVHAWHGLLAGVGVSASATMVPSPIAPRYGGRIAPGAGVFLTVRPAGP